MRFAWICYGSWTLLVCLHLQQPQPICCLSPSPIINITDKHVYDTTIAATHSRVEVEGRKSSGSPTRVTSQQEIVLSTKSSSLCLPGFHCVHGACLSATSCLCDQGWTGLFCSVREGVSNIEPSSPPLPSPITTTSTMEGSAVDGNETKIYKRWDQSGEESKTGAVTQSNNVTETDRECLPGFKCVHGVCAQGTLQCTCDVGWTGIFCHEVLVQDDDDVVSGKNSTLSPSSATSGREGNQSTGSAQGGGLWSPLDRYGPLADLSLRVCKPGFECRYGNCTGEDRLGCICERGFDGILCQHPCPLDCGPYGKCVSNVDREVHCECDPDYMGDEWQNCSLPRPLYGPVGNQVDLHWYAVGGCLGVAMLLLVVAVVVYILWRQGNISVLKLVFWYQNCEEDDGRLYDAFVSYASTKADRLFVMDQLVPVLEDTMNYTLCIHERDFTPGKYITSNIMDSVHQSRRTILVISPAFVTRNWCHFEFQTAVAEMIEKKHRILPIILGDLKVIREDTGMCDTLHRVLNTVTYLQYPGGNASDTEIQKFWTRLELSMPKRSNRTASSLRQTPSSLYIPSSSLSQSSLSEDGLPSYQSVASHNFSKQENSKNSSSDEPRSSDFVQISLETIPNHNDVNDDSKHSKSSCKRSTHQTLVSWLNNKTGRTNTSNVKDKVIDKAQQDPKSQTCKDESGIHPDDTSKGGTCKDESDIHHGDTSNGYTCKDESDTHHGDTQGAGHSRPTEIVLSNWTWPSPDDAQETC